MTHTFGRINIIAVILLCALSIPFAQTEYEARVQYFPKAELKAVNTTGKENTWAFILAGQSNMAGRGLVEVQDTLPSERILTVNKKGELVIAKEPLHFYEPSRTGLDCGLSFAKELLRQIPDSINILLLPAAVGGSSVSQWLGDSIHRNVQLLTNFKEKIQIAKKFGVVKGILWHQGENDANTDDIPLYKKRLKELFAKFRTIAGNDRLPIFVGELGSYSETNALWQMINEQITLYARSDNNVFVVRTSDLTDNGDKVHFNSEGQRVLGQRFANEYIKNKR